VENTPSSPYSVGMKYTQADITGARRPAEQAQAQVDSQAHMILRMRASRLSTVTDALRTMSILRDQMLARVKAMQGPVKVVPGTS
jgi:hypothetical protein